MTLKDKTAIYLYYALAGSGRFDTKTKVVSLIYKKDDPSYFDSTISKKYSKKEYLRIFFKTENNILYWGAPADPEEAIAECKKMQSWIDTPISNIEEQDFMAFCQHFDEIMDINSITKQIDYNRDKIPSMSYETVIDSFPI